MERHLIAILRGISVSEVKDIASCLIHAGINQIEIPLNSPNALKSIELLCHHFCGQAILGAGTVLSTKEVNDVYQLGVNLIVSPNCDPSVIKETKLLGMKSIPGVFTPSEQLNAVKNGADALKIFPASMMGAKDFRAIKAVLPSCIKTYAVGGISENDFSEWFQSGVTGFGLGSTLYSPGSTVREVSNKAERVVKRYEELLIKDFDYRT